MAHLGRRFGILKLLANRPATASEVSRTLGLSENAVAAWLEAAHTLGIVRRRGQKYAPSAKAVKLLVREDNPEFLGGLLSYYALRSLDFDGFDALFKGEKACGRFLAQAFYEGTSWDHTAFLKILLPRLPALKKMLEAGSNVLDLGCGSGGWIARLAPLYPKTSFLGVDPDREAVERAKKRCAGLANASFQLGRAEELAHREAFDLIYLGEVLYAVEDKEGALAACHRALKPSGWLVVCEPLRDRRSRDRVGRMLVEATRLDYMLQGGELMKKDRLVELLARAGFRKIRGHYMGGGLWFHVARKQQEI